MSYRAVADIPRAPATVWAVLTDVEVWTEWWGDAVSGVTPGWEVEGTVTWTRGGEAAIRAVEPEGRLELVSRAQGTRWLFELREAPASGTRFIFVEDFSDSRADVGDRDAKLAQNEATVARFRDSVVRRTPTERKWWQFWK